jgi:hypothetical protein
LIGSIGSVGRAAFSIRPDAPGLFRNRFAAAFARTFKTYIPAQA